MADVAPLRAGDPERVGPYEITGRLGRGGQGTVYLGQRVDDPERAQVAIKLLHPHFTDDPKARQRLLREASFAKKVARFCTAQVLDYGEDDERVYLVSEYVAGSSLTRLLERDGPRTGVALERLAISTVTALAAIHEAGVVHLDFKPANVLVGPDGPIVIDFGIAKALDTTTASTAQVVGSPAYMAPEQYNGMDVGPATDMFAWGVAMVHAATGTPAFGLASGPAMMQRILYGEPDLSGLEPPLREIVGACVAKDPTVRPSAQEVLLKLIGQSQDQGPQTTVPQPAAVTAPDPAPLYYLAAEPPPQNATLPPPVAEVAETAPPAGHYSMAAPPMAPQRPESSKTKALAIGGAAAAVVAIGLAAAIAVPMLGKSDRNTAEGTTTGATSASGSPTPGAGAGPGGSLPGGSATQAASASASAKPGGPSGSAAPQPTSGKGAPPPPQPSKGYVPPPAQSGSTGRPIPWSLQQICGSGMVVVDSHSLGRATVYLMYDNSSGVNCVTTTVQTSTGTNTMGAYLARQNGPSSSDTGSYAFYAGPVKVSARATCVRWGGTYGSDSWTSGWSHCG